MQGLESLTNLKILDVSNNSLKSLSGVQSLVNLTDLWANDNGVEDLDGVEAVLKPLSETLSTVYLRGNPCSNDSKYKLRMLFLLPKLGQLDDSVVER